MGEVDKRGKLDEDVFFLSGNQRQTCIIILARQIDQDIKR